MKITYICHVQYHKNHFTAEQLRMSGDTLTEDVTLDWPEDGKQYYVHDLLKAVADTRPEVKHIFAREERKVEMPYKTLADIVPGDLVYATYGKPDYPTHMLCRVVGRKGKKTLIVHPITSCGRCCDQRFHDDFKPRTIAAAKCYVWAKSPKDNRGLGGGCYCHWLKG